DDYDVAGNTTPSLVIHKGNDESGQVIYTGNDFIATRPFSGSGNANDGLCIYSQGTCRGIRGGQQHAPVGIAIDGAKSLWLPESANAGLLQVTPTGTTTTYTGVGAAKNAVPNVEYLHDSNNGGTLITPYGVAIDNEGNVWISNASCVGTLCTPAGTFTLTEIVGIASPTITTVSAQIAGGTNLVGTEPTK
ncbi:MAG: hypothetical protein ACRELF_13870, partial [Gemmataceae bacterium]